MLHLLNPISFGVSYIKLFRRFGHRRFNHCIPNVESASGFNGSLIENNRRLKELFKYGEVEQARQLFDEMSERDEFSWSTVISGYGYLGRFAEAKNIFDETPHKSCITWNSLVSGYCKHECVGEALALLCKMLYHGFRPTQFTLGSLLGMCSKLGFLRRGEQLHSLAVKISLEVNASVAIALVDLYAKCNCVLEAERLFQLVPDKNSYILWTALLTGYTFNGYSFEAMECFKTMLGLGIHLNQFSFSSILSTCALALELQFGKQVHGCIVKYYSGENAYVQSAFVDMYGKCGDLDSAWIVLDSMGTDSVVAWNAMLAGFVREGFEKEALLLFKRMNTKNMKVDEFTYPSVLTSCALQLDIRNAKSLHCLVLKSGFVNYNLVSNALVDMYAKHGSISCALTVFKNIRKKDVISWTSLFTGYVQKNMHEEALKLYSEMRKSGIYPDEFFASSSLSACAELTRLEFGKHIHAISIKSGLRSSLPVNNSLVSLYAKCGHIKDASRIFKSLQTRDLITWTALLVGYAQNGHGKRSIRIYNQMIASGIRPDHVTFIGLLFACSHDGLIKQGKYYFEAMSKIYGIKPGPEHYACIIDLLARRGKFSEVEKLLDEMAVEPNAGVWKTLLSACRVYGKIDLAERAAMHLFELEPYNAVPYILLANIYSAAGQWKDSAKVRGLMRSKGITKEPGYSWIELHNKVHTFMSEDRSHPRTTEIYSKVEEIIVRIKKAGYIPDLNFALHNVDDKEKQISLAYHSEKLAVAFALLSLPPNAPVVIFKNLRVCGDCHTAMKFVSEVFDRHIILRDANRFHHFRKGLCSCKDHCHLGSAAATVIPQHLLNTNSIFQGGLQPHNEVHIQAIVSAVTTGSTKYVLGANSNPHEKNRKGFRCGCASMFLWTFFICLHSSMSINSIHGQIPFGSLSTSDSISTDAMQLSEV